MTRLWSLAFRRSSIAPSVFTVRREFEDELTCWLTQRKLEHAERSGLFSSWVSGWAFADGGVTHYDRYGFGSMPSGYRVVGWRSLHTLIGDFGLRSPRASLAGEAAYSRAAHGGPPRQLDQAAALLTGYYDSVTFRWAVRRLLGDAALGLKRGDDAPASGQWGDIGFSSSAEALLAASMSPQQAATHSRQLGLQLLSRVDAFEPYRGITGVYAQYVLDLHRVDPVTISSWEVAGIPVDGALAAIKCGMDLARAREWLELGAATSPYFFSFLGECGQTPSDVASYLDLGVDLQLACRLAMNGTPPEEVADLIDQGREPMAVARFFVFGDHPSQQPAGRV